MSTRSLEAERSSCMRPPLLRTLCARSAAHFWSLLLCSFDTRSLARCSLASRENHAVDQQSASVLTAQKLLCLAVSSVQDLRSSNMNPQSLSMWDLRLVWHCLFMSWHSSRDVQKQSMECLLARSSNPEHFSASAISLLPNLPLSIFSPPCVGNLRDSSDGARIILVADQRNSKSSTDFGAGRTNATGAARQ
jgi:hypothetical protein